MPHVDKFGGASSDDVNAKQTFSLSVGNHFQHAVRFSSNLSTCQLRKARPPDQDLAVSLHGLLLAQANAGHFRNGVNAGGNQFRWTAKGQTQGMTDRTPALFHREGG